MRGAMWGLDALDRILIAARHAKSCCEEGRGSPTRASTVARVVNRGARPDRSAATRGRLNLPSDRMVGPVTRGLVRTLTLLTKGRAVEVDERTSGLLGAPSDGA